MGDEHVRVPSEAALRGRGSWRHAIGPRRGIDVQSAYEIPVHGVTPQDSGCDSQIAGASSPHRQLAGGVLKREAGRGGDSLAG